MGYLCFVPLSVMTAANVVSLPVPAVVGTAINSGKRLCISAINPSFYKQASSASQFLLPLPSRSPSQNRRQRQSLPAHRLPDIPDAPAQYSESSGLLPLCHKPRRRCFAASNSSSKCFVQAKIHEYFHPSPEAPLEIVPFLQYIGNLDNAM